MKRKECYENMECKRRRNHGILLGKRSVVETLVFNDGPFLFLQIDILFQILGISHFFNDENDSL